MKAEAIFKAYDDCVLNTYSRTPAIFVKGKGMTLIDIHGKKYLDFFPGWGVSNVGHCHPKVMAGVRNQIDKLIHIPNTLYHPVQAKLAKEIIRTSFPGKVFFGNSGAEGNEAAIKFARAYGKGKRYEILTMNKSFHGRTFGAMTATMKEGQPHPFGPLVPGFKKIPFNDFSAIEKNITDKTIGIHLELVQGEGGINIAEQDYIKKIRKICDEKDLILIVDEVQTGMGRTGEMFAFKHYGIIPDVMILAKALGGGLPIGAIVVRNEVADTFQPGMHASTFGGGAVICQAALGVFKAIHTDKMLSNTKKMGKYILAELKQLQQKYPEQITDVRGLGLMIGIELHSSKKELGPQLYKKCFEKGLIINCTQGHIIRFMPALNVTVKQANKAIYILEQALKECLS